MVVDEAQNLTPMELRMTVRRARGQSLTILGDLSQRTADAGVSSWDAVLGEAGVERHAIASSSSATACPTTSCVLAGDVRPRAAARRAACATPRGRRSRSTTDDGSAPPSPRSPRA